MLKADLICICNKKNGHVLAVCDNMMPKTTEQMHYMLSLSGFETEEKPITNLVNKNDNIKKQMYDLFEQAGLHCEPEIIDSQVIIDIEGDWKHDHGWLDTLMLQVFNMPCKRKVITHDTQSDWYGAKHYYDLK